MNASALAIGLALGVALWVATDNPVFISVGIVFAIIFGLFDKSNPDDDQPDASEGPEDASDDA